MGGMSIHRAAVGALVVAVMLLGSFQVPHQHVHTAIRARGHSCSQANLTQPVFSLESSDGRDGDMQVAAHAPVSLARLVAPTTDTVQFVPRARLAGFVSVAVRRLKLPPPSNDSSASL